MDCASCDVSILDFQKTVLTEQLIKLATPDPYETPKSLRLYLKYFNRLIASNCV
jgi:hypothetical protein